MNRQSMMNAPAQAIATLARSQRGASLLFALITLVALALAATALVRSVDTGAVVLGNLNSKKAAMSATDRMTQRAIYWLATRGGDAALSSDDANNGYYSSFKVNYDLTGFQGSDAARKLVNWDVDGSCAYATSGGVCDANTRPSNKTTLDDGVEGRFLITRLCTNANESYLSSTNSCAAPPKVGQKINSSRGEMSNALPRMNDTSPVPFYRIVVRIVGPRNAVTYAETIVNL